MPGACSSCNWLRGRSILKVSIEKRAAVKRTSRRGLFLSWREMGAIPRPRWGTRLRSGRSHCIAPENADREMSPSPPGRVPGWRGIRGGDKSCGSLRICAPILCALQLRSDRRRPRKCRIQHTLCPAIGGYTCSGFSFSVVPNSLTAFATAKAAITAIMVKVT